MIICKHGFWIDKEDDCRCLHKHMPGGNPFLQALVAIAVGCLVALACAACYSLL